jgi:hypothetical protein
MGKIVPEFLFMLVEAWEDGRENRKYAHRQSTWDAKGCDSTIRRGLKNNSP